MTIPSFLTLERVTSRRSILLACCFALALMMVACGPERKESVDNETLTVQTEDIAADFVASGDSEQARAALDALGVANPEQWLLYTTEQSIERGASETTNALVKLADALGMESGATLLYAERNGLTEISGNVVQTLAPVAGAVTAAQERAATDAAANAVESAENVDGATEAAQAALDTVSNVADTEAEDTEAGDTEEAAADESAGSNDAESSDETTELASSEPTINVDAPLNLRGGPGTTYNIIGSMQTGQAANILARNPSGDWWEVNVNGVQGWLYGPLVTASGDVNAVAVAADIPAPPAPTPAPVAQAPAPVAEGPAPAAPADPAPESQAETPAEVPAEAPAETTEENPAAEAPPEAAPAPVGETPHFTLVQKRLWNKQENDGCRGKHLAHVNVVDSNNVRLNGVTLQSPYTGVTLVTGNQGKGDGVVEYDLYKSGDAFQVMTDHKGRAATSDITAGATTSTPDIDQQTFIDAGYCSNDEDCQVFRNSWGCHGHYSWEFTLQLDRPADQ